MPERLDPSTLPTNPEGDVFQIVVRGEWVAFDVAEPFAAQLREANVGFATAFGTRREAELVARKLSEGSGVALNLFRIVRFRQVEVTEMS